ncbi:MAG TPA: tetratricopeptide repeat protein, partial [Pyrinomonadaceae bacterium]|nr:tetratricopeptide repeat protein [Pyrinomonadaceae bacterium]
ILVTADGTPKLLDFGIAKVLNPEIADAITLDPTATAMRLMTPEYASPEQVQGQRVTPATDVYSLGVLLYELLTGHRPYRLRNRAPHDVARVICEEEPANPSVRITSPDDLLPAHPSAGETGTLNYLYWSRNATLETLRRELAGDLDNIVMKALRKEPARRYQSAEELRDDITRHLEGRPVTAPKHAPAPAPRPAPVVVSEPTAGEKSIAVLPFKLIGARETDDTGDEYLGIGLADALITRLSSVRRFVVRPTSSVLRYGETGDDPLRAGAELSVEYVVDGHIRRAGDTLRVTVQLSEVGERATRWAGRFDQRFTDVLQLEDSISEQIASALIPRLTGEEQEQLAKRGTDNAQAYEAYLRGRYHWHGLTERGFARAIEEYNRAVALDPGYALAHAAIAVYHIFLGIFGVVPFAESSSAAAEAALKAVKLDPQLSEGHAALGFAVHCRDFNWEGAEEHHRRAIELNPHNSAAHNWYSFLLLAQGRFEEAVAAAHRAIELDPMTPLVSLSLAWCYYHSGRFEDALPVHRRVLETEPRFPYGRLVYSWSLMRAGAREDAVDEAERALDLAGDRGQLYVNGLAAAYAAAGRRADAQRMLERLREMAAGEYVSPYFLAIVHVHLGDKEKALLLLEEAVRVRDAWVIWLGVEPRFDPLRTSPRFQALVERTGNPLATGRAQGQERTQPTVAVLPFKLLDTRRNGETGEDYLGLGLADAVITRLSNVRRFVMRPTSSVMRF